MENSNRPVQRVIPIRSEFPNRINTNINSQNSNNCSETTCVDSGQQFKIINNNNELNRGNAVNIMDSLPFVQQNVNIMNINLSNNNLLQGISQDSLNGFSQSTANPKTYLQLADGRYVQIAQSIQPSPNQMSTILVQMPYKFVDQSTTNSNQMIMNSQFVLPSKVGEKPNPGTRFVTLGNNGGHCSNMFVGNQQVHKQQIIHQTPPPSDFQRTDGKDQMPGGVAESKLSQNVNANVNIISIDKYQEICDMLLDRKLLSKLLANEETVLVEFRLNQQKYQLRMTRAQKVEMEKLLISAGNQQRQMEILQVYQSEQRKNFQQRTSVVLNQIINKNPPNIVCNSPQIQTLNLPKPIFPLNSVLMSVPQNQYNDGNIMQSSKINYQNKSTPNQSTISIQNPSGVILNHRLPPAQSSILSVPSILREPAKDASKQKRVTKAPINFTQNIPNLSSNQDMKPARSRRFNNMRRVLCEDQNSVTMPNCFEPFEDLNDVAKRLVPYHIIEECKEHKFDEVDRILSSTFSELSRRCTNLKRIASSITMHDILDDKNDEQLLIKRMQLDLELDNFEMERVSSMNTVSYKLEDVSNDSDTVIVVEDSPPTSPVAASSERYVNDGDGILESISFMESMECTVTSDDNQLIQSPGENQSYNDVLDSLFNYDITDIGNDIVEECAVLGDDDEIHWIDDDRHKSPTQVVDDDDDDNNDNDNQSQSADPDLDAAIKSILF